MFVSVVLTQPPWAAQEQTGSIIFFVKMPRSQGKYGNIGFAYLGSLGDSATTPLCFVSPPKEPR